jgi:ribonucleoside-diphosphate reductase alpha chain
VKAKTYSQQEISEASFEFFQGDDLATKVWSTKYALKDSLETFMNLHPTTCIAGWPEKLQGLKKTIPNPLNGR